MLKALSVGAKACSGGRLYLYALAAADLGLPFIHFTPSNSVFLPAVRERFRTMALDANPAPPEELAGLSADGDIRLGPDPGAAAFALFAAQDHARDWLAPMLADGRAFACVAGPARPST